MRVGKYLVSVCGLCAGLVLFDAAAIAQIDYEYDALGRLVSVTHPDGKQTIYTYDAAGNRTAKTIYATVQNRTPEAGDDAYSMDEATTGEWDPRGNDTDADGNALTITNVTPGESGAVVITQSGTHVQYTPQLGFVGTDTFTYSADDGQGTFDTAVVTVTVNNLPPTATNDSASVDENASLTFDPRVNDSDPSGQPVTISAVTTPSNGTSEILSNGTEVKYTPTAGWNGSDSFDYTITGYHGEMVSATVSVSVNSTNQAPVAGDDSIQVGAGNGIIFDPKINDSDPDGDPITITAKTDGTQGTVTILSATQELQYDADPGASGTDSFTYTIEDPEGASDTATVNVTIPAQNSPPVANGDSYTGLSWGTTYTLDPITPNDTDPDGDTLEIISVSKISGTGSISISGSGSSVQISIPMNCNADPFGSFSYTISDGHGGTDTANILITINIYSSGCLPN